MPPRSLVEMCQRVIASNIQFIEGFGSMDSKTVATFLPLVKSAEQLYQIELDGEDDIYDHTPAHWKRIINRDFPTASRRHNWSPENPKSWYRVWKTYKKEQDEALAAATKKLAKTYADAEEAKDKKRIQIVDVGVAKTMLPKFGTVARGLSSSSVHWSNQPRPKTSALSKVKSQVKSETRRLKLTTATGRLPVKPGQLTRAPDSFLRDARVARQFDPTGGNPGNSSSVRAPGASLLDVAQRTREREEREARLLRAKGAPPRKNVLSFDDDDDDKGTPGTGAGLLDDLFGDLEASAAPSPSAGNSSRPTPASTLSSSNSPATAARPNADRRGQKLLSAAPGSTRATTTPRPANPAPATRPTPTPALTSPPPPKPAAGHTGSPPTVPTSAPGPKRKKAPVDIFLRPKKKART